MQTEISLSTTDAEYISLLTAALDIIPMRRQLLEIPEVFKMACNELTLNEHYLKIIKVHKNWPTYLNTGQEQNTLPSSFITLENGLKWQVKNTQSRYK